MDDDAVLLTYAGVGVAFAGFAALVTLIRRPDAAEAQPAPTRRLRAMVQNALLATAFVILALISCQAKRLWEARLRRMKDVLES